MAPKRKVDSPRREPYNLRSRNKVAKKNKPIRKRTPVITKKAKQKGNGCSTTAYKPNQRTPENSMNDLAGIDDIKEIIMEEVILPFTNPTRAESVKIEVPRGVLLVGCPGTGKTALADAIVHELQKNKMKISFFMETGNCLSCYLGETEGKLRSLFREADKQAPSVIFLDELDGLARKRSGSPNSENMSSVMTTLLVEMNNVRRGHVLVIAATNVPQLVDPALIRDGRFDLTIEIPLPEEVGRKSILAHYLSKLDHKLKNEVLNKMAKVTENCTGSTLKALCQLIHVNAIRRVFPNGSWASVGEAKLKALMPALTKLDVQRDILPALREKIPNFNIDSFH